MIEFGEKLKRLHEEKGMTQQTVADQLYVTRQAVSRWECGARYPDLLTTKKIAALLETTIDELVADEEVKRDIQKEPVFTTPMSNAVQIVLYFICAFAGLIMLISSSYISYPWNGITGVDGKRDFILYFSTICKDVIYVGIMLVGAILAIRNEISSKKTGVIMSIPFVTSAIMLVVNQWLAMSTGQIRYTIVEYLIASVAMVIPLIEAFTIYRFFASKRAITSIPIYLFALVEVGLGVFRIIAIWEPMAKVEAMRPNITLFVLLTIGNAAFGMLLANQTYCFQKKRKNVLAES